MVSHEVQGKLCFPQWKAENEDTAAAAQQSRRNGEQRRQVVQLNISILIKHDKWFHADA